MASNRILLRSLALARSSGFVAGQSLVCLGRGVGSGSPHATCISQPLVLRAGVPKSGFMPDSPSAPPTGSPIPAGTRPQSRFTKPGPSVALGCGPESPLWGKGCAQLEGTLGSQSPQLLGRRVLPPAETHDPLNSALCSNGDFVSATARQVKKVCRELSSKQHPNDVLLRGRDFPSKPPVAVRGSPLCTRSGHPETPNTVFQGDPRSPDPPGSQASGP